MISDDVVYGRQALSLGEPWIVPESLAYLRTILSPSWSVFEWGAGGSTVFWAKNCASIISIEHHPDWAKRVREMLLDRGLSPHVVQYIARDDDDTFHSYADAILVYPEDSFDLVFVDGEASCRDRCLANALSRIRPGGWLLLDNSNWYTVGIGWERQDFIAKGLTWVGQPGTFDWWTSIFKRPHSE